MASLPNFVVLDVLEVCPNPFQQLGGFFGVDLDKLLATAQVILQCKKLGLNMAVEVFGYPSPRSLLDRHDSLRRFINLFCLVKFCLEYIRHTPITI